MDGSGGAGRRPEDLAGRRRGMGTGQMVVLWYAVVLMVFMLGVAAFEAEAPTVAVILAVVILAAALIYTLRRHPGVKKRKLGRLVLVPLCGTLMITGIIAGMISCREAGDERREEIAPDERLLAVEPSEVEVFDVKLEWYRGGRENSLSGRVRNNSNKTIYGVGMTVELYNRDGKMIDRGAGFAKCSVRPGGVGGFSGYVQDVKPSVARMRDPPVSGYREWYFEPYTMMWEKVDCSWRYSDVVAYTKE